MPTKRVFRSVVIAEQGSYEGERAGERPEIDAKLETYRNPVREWRDAIADSSQEVLDLHAGSPLDWRVDSADPSTINGEHRPVDLDLVRNMTDVREEAIV